MLLPLISPRDKGAARWQHLSSSAAGCPFAARNNTTFSLRNVLAKGRSDKSFDQAAAYQQLRRNTSSSSRTIFECNAILHRERTIFECNAILHRERRHGNIKQYNGAMRRRAGFGRDSR